MVNEINFKNLKLIFLISKLIKKSFKKDERKIVKLSYFISLPQRYIYLGRSEIKWKLFNWLIMVTVE